MAEAHAKGHDYHLVDPSPWPIIGAVSAFILAIAAIGGMHGASWLWVLPGVLGVLYTMYAWWSDVIAEAHGGDHTRTRPIQHPNLQTEPKQNSLSRIEQSETVFQAEDRGVQATRQESGAHMEGG